MVFFPHVKATCVCLPFAFGGDVSGEGVLAVHYHSQSFTVIGLLQKCKRKQMFKYIIKYLKIAKLQNYNFS